MDEYALDLLRRATPGPAEGVRRVGTSDDASIRTPH